MKTKPQTNFWIYFALLLIFVVVPLAYLFLWLIELIASQSYYMGA